MGKGKEQITRDVPDLKAGRIGLEEPKREKPSTPPPSSLEIPGSVDWGVSLLIFLLAVLYLRLFYYFTVFNGDEGIVLQGAQRVLEGEVPYRDFFSFYTPGSFYWIALFFRIFGSSILVGRAVLLAEGGIFSVLTYLLARRVCTRWNALLAAYFVTLTCVPCMFMVLHNWDSTLWAYLALYCAVCFLERPRPAWSMATGLFASLTCLFEQSKGATLVLGLVAGFAILAWTSRPSRHGRATARQDEAVPILWTWRRGAAVLAGLLGPFLVTFVYFGLKHSLPQLLADWVWPLHYYSTVNKTSFGYIPLDISKIESIYTGSPFSLLLAVLITGPWYVVPVLPFLAALILVYWSFKAWRGTAEPGKARYYVLTSAALAGLVVSTLATGRHEFNHLVYLGPILFLVLAWILDGRDIPFPLLRKISPVLVLFLLLAFTGYGMALLSQPLNSHRWIEARRGTLKTNRPDQVLDYLQAHVAAGETLLVYPYLPLYYYLTATRSPGRHDYLQPGLHSPQQFEELRHELAADRTRVVLFEPSFREKTLEVWPSITPSELAAPDPVEGYITTHYRACASLTTQNTWRFAFMVRKDLPCPDRDSSAR